jgi:RNA polymerase sigma-70 factor, ECF subfamily
VALSAEPIPAVLDDCALVTAAREGDPSAFGELYERYGRMVHGILLARAPRDVVEDLQQEVAILAWRRLRSLRDASRFGGWLAAIARNCANDFHRHAAPEEAILRSIQGGEEVEGRQNHADEDGKAILAIVKGLPEAYRETLILRLVEGMNGPEIAKQTGLTEGSVRVNLHRGMQMLRERLAKAGLGVGSR